MQVHSLLLPFAGFQGITVGKNLNITLKNVLPNNVITCITYTGQKLSSKFQIKDKTDEKHKHNLIYYTNCPEPFCTKDYLGEITQNHWHIDLGNMKIIDSSFHKNKLKWKISEALYIKQYWPSLNSQEQSLELKLFNWFHYLLYDLCNYINFYHCSIILVFYSYFDNDLWNV